MLPEPVVSPEAPASPEVARGHKSLDILLRRASAVEGRGEQRKAPPLLLADPVLLGHHSTLLSPLAPWSAPPIGEKWMMLIYTKDLQILQLVWKLYESLWLNTS